MKYLALLRGINVGGNNIIKMAELKHVLTEAGFVDVVTYIQSGNVIFSSDEKNIVKISTALELTLSKAFSYVAKVVVISQSTLKAVINAAPPDWSTRADIRQYVAFLKEPTTTKEALAAMEMRDGVDWVASGPGVIYMTTLTKEANHSKFTKMMGKPIYKQMTIRNFNTTQKLMALMETK